MGSGHAHALFVHEHSRIHRLAPEVKLVATFLFVVGVAITPRETIWAFAVDAVAMAVAIRLGRLPYRFVVARLVVILPFVTFAFFVPFIASGEQIQVIGLDVSREGLWAMWNILAKASLGATASIVLAGTTELPDIIRGMSRLRLPVVVTSIASFMIRYLELIAAEMGRMRIAMVARGHDPRWLWQAKPIAAASGALFVRSYERGERVHEAMLARGYTGTMPDLDPDHARASDWATALVLPAVSLVIAAVALVSM